MLTPDGAPVPACRRIPLVIIDQVVSARLGQTRVQGNAQPAVFKRQIAMYLAKHLGGWSTPRIGRFYNGRDHSTVCYALKRVAALRENDPEVNGLVSSLAGEIKTAKPNDSGRMDTGTQMRVCPETPHLNEAFLDALAERLAMRILNRAKGIDANAAFGPKCSPVEDARVETKTTIVDHCLGITGGGHPGYELDGAQNPTGTRGSATHPAS